jgi:regulator of RNase E activity RraA
VPVACGGVLVPPGDLIIADDDEAVVVPAWLAPDLLKAASEHVEWDGFSRLRLAEGGDVRRHYALLDKHYPLSEEARPDSVAWRAAQR